MKLLVRKLSRDTTEEQLRVLFEAYGTVQYSVVVMDKVTGNSKGFGFVEMPRPGDAKAAVKSLNGRKVDGSKIRVKSTGIPSSDKSSAVTETEKASGEKPSDKPDD